MADKNSYCALGLAKIVSANSFTRIYKVQLLFQSTATSGVLTAVSIGSRGNTDEGAQVSPTYKEGDLVLIAYQPDAFLCERMHLAYIIGTAPYDIFVGEDLSEWVKTSHLGFANINPYNFTKLDLLEATVDPGRVIKTHTGHGSADLLPGDYEIAGKLVSLHVGDYLAGFHATGAEFWVDPLTRRLVEQSLLRTVNTINATEDMAIVNDSTITTQRRAGNVRDAFYNLIDDTKDGMFPKGFDPENTDPGSLNPKNLGAEQKPLYRSITQEGDLLYGRHHVILAEDGATPLYYDYTALDGSRAISSISGFTLQKTPLSRVVTYKGDRIATPKLKDDSYPDPKEINDPLHNLDTSDETLWEVFQADEDLQSFVDSYGFPETFVDPDKAAYDPDEPRPLNDSYLEDKQVEVYPKSAKIDFESDGSIKITDGWGSYIYLSHGNVEIHAVNNLFKIAGRDMLAFAGANQTLYAEKDVSFQACNGDFVQIAGKDMRLLAASTAQGLFTIESKYEIDVIGKAFYVDALEQLFRCRDITDNGNITGAGMFFVDAPYSQIYFKGSNLQVDATDAVTLATTTHALVVDNEAITIVGDIKLLGGLTTSEDSFTVPVLGTNGQKTADRVIIHGSMVDIKNVTGGIMGRGPIRTESDITATGNIVGDSVMAFSPRDGKLHAPRNIAAIKRANKVKSPKASKKPPLTQVSDYSLKTWSNPDISDKTFRFTKPSTACTYILAEPQPTRGGVVSTNSGYPDKAGNKQYIYPGTAFWTRVGGLVNQPEDRPGKFIDLKWAEPNN